MLLFQMSIGSMLETPKIIQSIAIVLGGLLAVEDKLLLLKIPHTWDTGYGYKLP